MTALQVWAVLSLAVVAWVGIVGGALFAFLWVRAERGWRDALAVAEQATLALEAESILLELEREAPRDTRRVKTPPWPRSEA